jgi:hypothetical protein
MWVMSSFIFFKVLVKREPASTVDEYLVESGACDYCLREG